MTSSCQEGSSAKMRELSLPRITACQEQRSHPRGRTGSSRASSRQGPAQGSPRGQSTLATTAPSGEEASPSALGARTAATPSLVGARGLAAPRATAIRPMIAYGTSISYIHFDLNLSAQTRPRTHVGLPTAPETVTNLWSEPRNNVLEHPVLELLRSLGDLIWLAPAAGHELLAEAHTRAHTHAPRHSTARHRPSDSFPNVFWLLPVLRRAVDPTSCSGRLYRPNGPAPRRG
jgi:hypothetical protein